MMEKHGFSLCYGLIILGILLVGSMSFASANTLVGGKIYNSDFSDVIEGADVSVQCGGSILDTLSLEDGAYAVTFDTDSCYSADKVSVTASKGELNGEEDSIINNSTEDEGEYIAVANVNIKNSVSVSTRRHRGTWFQCGNTVCDTGETPITCPSDCSEEEQENENPNPLIDLSFNDGSGNGDDSLPGETQTTQDTRNIPGIIGAVTGTGDGDHDYTFFVILGTIVLLAIAIGVVGWMREKEKESWESN